MNKIWCFSLKNFGDALTPYIFKKLGIPFELVADPEQADVFGIGSILRRVPRNKRIRVWTSGMITPQDGSELRFGGAVEILALRGVLTQAKIAVPSVSQVPLGDGGLMVRETFNFKEVKKTHRLGVIVHMSDWRSNTVLRLRQDPDIICVNALGDVEAVLRSIASCEHIVSSSLHGVIVADAFGIPNAAIRFSDSGKNVNDQGKFVDYGSALERPLEPVVVSSIAGAAELLTVVDLQPQRAASKLEVVVGGLERTLDAFR